MAFKGLFGAIKGEIGKEIKKQFLGGGGAGEDGGGGGHSSGSGGGGGSGFNMGMVQDILGLLSGGGGSSGEGGKGTGVQKILRLVQKYGANLPGDLGKYLPGILKIAEVLGHGLGDDTPRTEKDHEGNAIDDFLKTLISGRKIFGGGGGKTVKDTTKGGGRHMLPGYFPRSDANAQDFADIRAQCFSAGTLFEDPEFPAVDSSVFYSNADRRRIYWKRPHEIAEDPQFFVDEASRFDVIQGELGDCWLLAAVANLTLSECSFRNVVPSDNSFAEGEYCGLFHFRFWQYGKWVDIVVDDQLPCDASGKLLYMHSEVNNEFWSALLEKAYAKLYGSYEALKGGTTCEALVDFTGGVTELYDIQNGPDDLYKLMSKAWERSSFLGCSIEPDPRIVEMATPQGLIRGHAYSITDIRAIDIETPRVAGKIPLLRIRNPWGNDGEWNGAWSDGSPEWENIDEDMREEIGLTFDADGEFWMSNQDFLKYFQRVEICNLSPDALEDVPCSQSGKKWETSIYEGAWIQGQSAGGCRNNLDTFASNPQYVITLADPDEGDEEEKCTVIIGLMQKNRRELRAQGMETLAIGFAIYAIDDSSPTPLPTQFFKLNASVARAPTFINLREVSCRFRLPPGSYCIVPSTFERDEEAEFILRVFSETPSNMMENE